MALRQKAPATSTGRKALCYIRAVSTAGRQSNRMKGREMKKMLRMNFKDGGIWCPDCGAQITSDRVSFVCTGCGRRWSSVEGVRRLKAHVVELQRIVHLAK